MKQIVLWCTAVTAFSITLMVFSPLAVAQLGNQAHQKKTDVSSYPPDIQTGYRVFTTRCSVCHSLALSLNQSRSASGWTAVVHRMQAKPNSHISNQDAAQIVKFLAYYDTHHKMPERNASGVAGARSSVLTGKQVFHSYGCSSCHSIAGVGNTRDPLDGIGSKTTPAGLKNYIVQHIACLSRLRMKVPNKALNSLVAYLAKQKKK